jgi:16S rRNA (guanine1207-N2)-methyltransferase
MPEGHYFDSEPVTRSRPTQVELVLGDFRAWLHTDAGVFAGTSRRVDPGTVELLKAIPAPPTTGNLVDLGCGYGPIACTLASRSPAAMVWAVDVNQRALDLTIRNARELGLANVKVSRPEDVPASLGFAGLWSNPPIRIGKPALHDLLERWLARLQPDAQAWLVVQRHLGSDSLAAWLSAGGRRVTRVASKRGYRILRVGS